MSKEFENLPTSPDEGMACLRKRYISLCEIFGDPLELLDPGFYLDLESRAGNQKRMIKHIQQMCLMHATAFVRSNWIKLTYLVHAYLVMIEARNPVGAYAISRNLLELNAFLFEVRARLLDASNGDERDWQPRGESFFRTIVRARCGTSDASWAEQLTTAGISKSALKPMNIMSCIAKLSNETGFVDIHSRYGRLCDFVHHNLSSQTVSSEGTFIGDVARNSAGELRDGTGTTGPITRYRYPAEGKAHKAVEDTIAGAVLDQEAAVVWLNGMPDSPYQADELTKWTGSKFGIQHLKPHSTVSRMP